MLKSKVITFVRITTGIVALLVGTFLLMFDGFCAGGKSCTRMPGILAFLGAVLIATSIQLFISGRIGYKRVGIALITTLLLYGWRLLSYYLL